MENYNETHFSRNRKYTINIPNKLFDELTVKVKEIDEEMPMAVYLRILLRREVVKKRILETEEIISATDEIIQKPYRREWKFNLKKFIDKAKSRQLYFF